MADFDDEFGGFDDGPGDITPDIPDVPDVPDIPDIPDTPDFSDLPEISDVPEISDAPDFSGDLPDPAEEITLSDDPVPFELAEPDEEITLDDAVTDITEDETAFTELPETAAESTEIPAETPEVTDDPMADMAAYMSEHNYGMEDRAEYINDPEYQAINDRLLAQEGMEPADYRVLSSETSYSGDPYADMAEYMSEHNYGIEDRAEYINDPEYRILNDRLLAADGQELPDYPEIEETAEPEEITLDDELPEEITFDEEPDITDDADTDLPGELAPESDLPDNTEEDGGTDLPGELAPESDLPDDTGEDGGTDLPGELEPESDLPDDTGEDGGTDLPGELAPEPDLPDDTGEDGGTDLPGELAPEPDLPDDTGEDETGDLPAETELPAETTDTLAGLIEDNSDYAAFIRDEYPEYAETGCYYAQGLNEYGYEGTCGPTSQANAVNYLFNSNELTENKVLNIAVENGLCDTSSDIPSENGGTTTDNFMDLYGKLNEELGDRLEVERFDCDNALSTEEMAQRLEEGSVLNIAVDSATLWDENDHIPGMLADDVATDHWITVTGVDRAEDGTVTGFHLIDSGGGETYADVDKYERMCFGEEGREMLDPTCIVLSKKGS